MYGQKTSNYTTLFIIISALHVSGGISAHHQELTKLHVQAWVFHAFLLSTAGVDWLELEFQPIQTSGRQQESMTIPKAAHTVL